MLVHTFLEACALLAHLIRKIGNIQYMYSLISNPVVTLSIYFLEEEAGQDYDWVREEID